MYVPLPLEFHFKILATMNNKKQTKQPLFAEVNLTGDEFKEKLSYSRMKVRKKAWSVAFLKERARTSCLRWGTSLGNWVDHIHFSC